MSHYIRPRRPGASLFFTVALADRSARTLVERVDDLREAVRLTKTERPFHINAWVVLPDHMHCVWTLPEGDAAYSLRMAAIKARFTAGLRRSGFRPTLSQNQYGVVGGRRRVGLKPDLRGREPRGDEASIWQKRFWEHHIRDETAFAACVRYCWFNPVKHGLADHPKDWPYSSWHRDGSDDVV